MKPLCPIGVFDSGYGGLTILSELEKFLPQYDYLYLGDNARAPYGPRSFETVFEYTLECVNWLFSQNCPLVILACNTASAKALRNIQQNVLPGKWPGKRVLGVIRPAAEYIGSVTRSGHIGILATTGTVKSNSYVMEIERFYPGVQVFQQDCPMWVPLIENGEAATAGSAYFVKRDVDRLLKQSAGIDTILLGCTHYPLLEEMIRSFLPPGIRVVSQGQIIASSLTDYLQRHIEIENRCSKTASRTFYTTDDVADFDRHSGDFYGDGVTSLHVVL